MFNRRELSLLRARYRHESVTAAASAVHMSQPAASALLQDMESRVGFALFRREKRRLHLTSQGRSLMPEVLNALTGMESVDRLASEIRRGASDRLVVGAVAVASSMLLPQALVRVRRSFPRVSFTLRTGSALEIVEMAVDHRIDLGICIGPAGPDDRVDKERLAPISLYAVMPPDHASAAATHPNLADIAALGLIVLSPALPAGAATRQALDIAGLRDEPLMEVAQSFTACELANVGLGVAIVESLGARYAQRMGMVAKLLMTIEDSALSIVAPRDRPLEGAGLYLRDALREALVDQRGAMEKSIGLSL